MDTNFNRLLKQLSVVTSTRPEAYEDEELPFPHEVDPGMAYDEEPDDEFAEAFGLDEDDDLESEEEDEEEAMSEYADIFGQPKRPRAKAQRRKTGQVTVQPPVQVPIQAPPRPVVIQPTISAPRQPLTIQPTTYQAPTIPAIQPVQPTVTTIYPQTVQPVYQQGVNEPNDVYQTRLLLTQRIQQRFPNLDGPTIITLGELILNYVRYGVIYDPSVQETVLAVLNAIST